MRHVALLHCVLLLGCAPPKSVGPTTPGAKTFTAHEDRVSFIPVSEGFRDGVVQKFSFKGDTLATKTWEGELAMQSTGSYHGKGGQASRTEKKTRYDWVGDRVDTEYVDHSTTAWSFSVADVEIVRAIQTLSPGQIARLHYVEMPRLDERIGKTTYIVTKVQPFDPLDEPEASVGEDNET